MIEKNKQSLELPIVGQSYIGKHGEKLTVDSIGDSAYGRRGWTVGYTIIGPHFVQQSMSLERFMQWAKDDPQAKPRHVAEKRPIEFNPFAEMKQQPCNHDGKNGCSEIGWIIDGQYFCSVHYIVAELRL